MSESIIFSNDKEKHDLSKKLSSEVEAWLASGGETKQLGNGESLGQVDYTKNYDREKRNKDEFEKAAVSSHKPRKAKVLSSDALRRKKLIEAKREAIEMGLSEFQAECRNHGMTNYAIRETDGKTYCVKCKREMQSRFHEGAMTDERKEDNARKRRNREKAKEAISTGKKIFTAECKHHGVTDYIVINIKTEKKVHRCKKCRSEGL